jgi:LemA protein
VEIVVLVVAIVIGAVLLGFNRLVRLRNRVEAAWADLDVQLTRRRDLIPNLVSTVQGYAEHERGLFTHVAQARADAARVADTRARADAEAAIDDRLGRLLVVAEAYPELEADARFRELSDELIATENKIAFSRQLYNDTVDAYRTAIESFPGLLYARPLGFAPRAFFVASGSERLPGAVRLGGE